MDPARSRVHAGRVEEPKAGSELTLTDEGEVVITAGGVRDRGAAVGRDTQVGQIGDAAAVDTDRPNGVADADGVPRIAAAVDVADADSPAIGGRGRHAAVPCELHDGLPSLLPTLVGTRLPVLGSSSERAAPPGCGRPLPQPLDACDGPDVSGRFSRTDRNMIKSAMAGRSRKHWASGWCS